jgi:hypothetical protein
MVAPIAGIGGVWIGKRWDRKTGYDAWLRSERQAAYSLQLANAHRVWTAAADHYHDTYLRPFDDDEMRHTGGTNRVWDAVKALQESTAQVELIGPSEVGAAAVEIIDQAQGLLNLLADPDQVRPIFKRYGERLTDAPQVQPYIRAVEKYQATAGAVTTDQR